ncbi:type II secretion system protein [Candidatus Curtissbacteria bacterium]|nr:type II secretion system protein [Candidatus Curtissbacteria bacterium]
MPRLVRSLEFVVGRLKTTHYPPPTTHSSGFTLIELLIVVTILGVLAATIIIAINPAKRNRQARDSARKSDVGQIANSLKAYFALNGAYPPGSGAATGSGLTVMTATGDLAIIPSDPSPNGGQYQYLVWGTGSNSESAVYATLEDPTSGSGIWLWCWQSTAERPDEVTLGSCTI